MTQLKKIHLTRTPRLNLKINAFCRFLMIKNTLHKNQESKVKKTSDADVVCYQEIIKKVKVNDRIRIRENDHDTWTNVKVHMT